MQKSEVSGAIFIDKKKYIELFNNKEMVEAIKYCNKVLEKNNPADCECYNNNNISRLLPSQASPEAPVLPHCGASPSPLA